MKRVLTDAKVRNLRPKDEAYKAADGGGMYLYITKSGTKSFRYDTKLHGKRFTITFGTYPVISLAEARDLHLEARNKIAKGIDPRSTAPEKMSFSYYALKTMKRLELKESTYNKRLGRMQNYLFPALDKKVVTEITALDILQLLDPIADSGRRELAQRLAIYCRQTFDDLLNLQLIQNNPADSVKRTLPKVKNAKNFAHLTSSDDLALFVKSLSSHKGDYAVGKAVRFMVLVFLRPQNIRFLKWDYVDFENKLITYPPGTMKMNKEFKVPLSKQALSILNDMKSLTGRLDYVFLTTSGIRSGGKPMSENTLNVAITKLINPETKMAFGRGFITSHGMRHTASTQLNEQGFNPDAIELQLAHASKDRIRATYNKAELLPERIEMMQKWADYLDELVLNN